MTTILSKPILFPCHRISVALTHRQHDSPFSIKNVQECRCGAVTCRGVLGPKPKEAREAKDTLRHKFQLQLPQTLQPPVQPTTHKKPKLTIPHFVKDTFASIKSRTTDRLTKARGFASSNTRHSKKVSERLLKGGKRNSVTETASRKVRRRTAVTYSRRTPSVTPRMQDRLTDGTSAKRGHNVLLSVHARGRTRTSNGTFAKKEASGELPRDVAQDLLDLAAAVTSDSSLSPEPEPISAVKRPVRKTANPVFSSCARAPTHHSESLKGNGDDPSAQSTSAKLSAHARARARGPGGAFASSKKSLGKSRSSTAANNQSTVDRDVTPTATRHNVDHHLPPYTDTTNDTFAAASLASSGIDIITTAPASQVVNTTGSTSSHPRSSLGNNNRRNNNTDSSLGMTGDCLPPYVHDPLSARSPRAPFFSQSKSTESSAVTPVTTPATTPSTTGNPKLSVHARSRERTSSGYFVKSPSEQKSPSASTKSSNSAGNPKLSAHAKARVRSPGGTFAKRKRSDESPSRTGNPKLAAHARKRQRGPGGVFLGGRIKSELATTRAVNTKSVVARRKRRSSAGTFLSVDANGQLLKQDPPSDSSSSEEEPVGGTEAILQAASRVSDSIRSAMSILKGSSKQSNTEDMMGVAKD